MAEADCEGGVHACVGLMSSSHVGCDAPLSDLMRRGVIVFFI
jgi:hypothetical protein